MSSIKDKVYNASQKIIRAVFHGAPNLFTTPDINRQLDVFDHRFGMLEGFLPATSDMTFSVANGEAKMTYSYLEVAGVQLYKGSSKTDVITDGFYNDDHLIGLYVKRKLVTYANDGADHLISGAVFVDGTSMAAADHYVISTTGSSSVRLSPVRRSGCRFLRMPRSCRWCIRSTSFSAQDCVREFPIRSRRDTRWRPRSSIRW